MLYIVLMNSSVTLCLFGFKRSILRSPQMKMSFWLIFEKDASIQLLNDSMLEPGALYIQLIITFLFFSLQISIVIHSNRLSTAVDIFPTTL